LNEFKSFILVISNINIEPNSFVEVNESFMYWVNNLDTTEEFC